MAGTMPEGSWGAASWHAGGGAKGDGKSSIGKSGLDPGALTALQAELGPTLMVPTEPVAVFLCVSPTVI